MTKEEPGRAFGAGLSYLNPQHTTFGAAQTTRHLELSTWSCPAHVAALPVEASPAARVADLECVATCHKICGNSS